MYCVTYGHSCYSFASISSLLSLLNFLMGTNTILVDIPTKSMPDTCTYRQRGESEICNSSAILEMSGITELEEAPLIVPSLYKFYFPIDFTRGQLGGGGVFKTRNGEMTEWH